VRIRNVAALVKREDVRSENRRTALILLAVAAGLVIYSVIVIIVKHS
jgi:hypothetical protein